MHSAAENLPLRFAAEDLSLVRRRNKKGETPRDVAANLDTVSRTCKMRKFLDKKQVSLRSHHPPRAF
jgi:hypothetical protein